VSDQIPRFEVEDEYTEELHRQDDGGWTTYKVAAELQGEVKRLRGVLEEIASGQEDPLPKEMAHHALSPQLNSSGGEK
jgi:hypothetical protein